MMRSKSTPNKYRQLAHTREQTLPELLGRRDYDI